MKIKRVETKKDIKTFLTIPVGIYKNDSNWVRPLDNDIEEVFNPKTNKYFRHGDAARWILLDDKGKGIGRVAAFYDKRTADLHDQSTGGMGFYECIDNKKAAFILFDKCFEWLKDKGMQAMDGPINFGEKNKWWGLLVEGTTPPIYCMNYHLPYYREHFEAYGFKTYYEQYCFKLPVGGDVQGNFYEKAERIRKKPGYHTERLDKKNLLKYAEDFRKVYNEAWITYDYQKPMASHQAMTLFKRLNPVIDRDLVWFAYYNNDPIAFFIMLPEINQIVRHLNGSLNWLGKLKFAYYQWKGECDRIFGLVFGVIPRFQGKGVEGFIIIEANDLIRHKKQYKELELNWIGDFNPKMLKVAANLEGKQHRTYLTMRKLFDENQEFKRRKIMTN